MADGFLIGESLLARIRASVDVTEKAIRKEEPYRIPTRLEGDGGVAANTTAKAFRVCTFTGAWSKNSDKNVTFKYQTTTPNTVVATNLFAAIGATSSARNCAIAREGTAWFLVAAEC